MKILALSAVMLSFTFFSKAQKVDTVYFDKKWVKTDKANSYYYRTIEKLPKKNLKVKDYYPTGVLQMEGDYASLEPEVKNGIFVFYYASGIKREEYLYKNDEPSLYSRWDESGTLIKKGELVKVTNKETGESEFLFIEKTPKFVGGNEAFNKFIEKNVKYPVRCQENGLEAKVIVSFVVTKEGDIKDEKVINRVDPLFEKEALRVIRLMPKWEPGMQGGKVIDVRLNESINFILH